MCYYRTNGTRAFKDLYMKEKNELILGPVLHSHVDKLLDSPTTLMLAEYAA
jgi:hypothetical protein